jgi:hypothetical protein
VPWQLAEPALEHDHVVPSYILAEKDIKHTITNWLCLPQAKCHKLVMHSHTQPNVSQHFHLLLKNSIVFHPDNPCLDTTWCRATPHGTQSFKVNLMAKVTKLYLDLLSQSLGQGRQHTAQVAQAHDLSICLQCLYGKFYFYKYYMNVQ